MFRIFPLLTLVLCITATATGFWLGHNQGFASGAASVAPIDQVAGLDNKTSDGKGLQQAGKQPPATTADFATFWQSWALLEKKFIPLSTSTDDAISRQERVSGAIRGLTAAYNDPYTTVLETKQNQRFREQVRGSFEGIGARVGVVEGAMVVVEPLVGSPALAAGLAAGDVIVAVDGQTVLGRTLDQVIETIRGPGGSIVTLTVNRHGVTGSQEIPITRGTIAIPSTVSTVVSKTKQVFKDLTDAFSGSLTGDKKTSQNAQVINPETGQPAELVEEAHDFFVIKLASFSGTSPQAFADELQRFKDAGTNNLLIDLRDNPGGLLNVAVDIASHFIPQDGIIAREEFGRERTERLYVSKNYGTFAAGTFPTIVVLVNERTASAAEILSAALREHGLAQVVGVKTFGKGSVQELVEVNQDLSLKVTVARWYTPLGTSLSENGLTPDIVVDPSTSTSSDPILDAGLELLLEEE